MKHTLVYMVLLLALVGAGASAQTPLRVVSYNVENLFYPESDSLHFYADGDEYTPSGARHWTFSRYRRKLSHIAEVLAGIGGWDRVALVGLQEVEEVRCLQDLTTYNLRSHAYDYLLFEGPDSRGVDVALLFDTTQLSLLSARPVAVPMPEGERPTRDLLYAELFSPALQLRLHVLVCHMPSQLGGARVSAPRREAAHKVLRSVVDSVLSADSLAAIVVMGDFNTSPQDNLSPLVNLMLPMAKAGRGTEKYHGEWSCLDQIYISPSLLSRSEAQIFDADYLLEPDPKYLGVRPRRTYQGYRYRSDGYSDHLPVALTLR